MGTRHAPGEARDESSPPFPSVWAVAGLMLIVAALWVQWTMVSQGYGLDLQVYLRGARALLGGEGLYDISVGPRHLPFTYSPFAAVLFVPLTLLPFAAAGTVVTLGSLGCYASVLVLVARRLALGAVPTALVALAGLAMEPVRLTVVLGQVNLLLLLLVVVDCLVIGPRHRGWLVGIAAGVKIVPGVFVVYFALKRDWGAVLRCGLGFVLTVVVGALVSPSASLRYWSGGFMALGRWGEDPVGVLNQSFNGVWLRHAGEQQASTLVTVALCLAGVGVGAVVAARRLRRADDLGAVLALGLGGLLASPISWPHHWLWVIPMLMLLVARGRTAWAWVFGVLFCTDPLLLLAGPDAAQALQLPGWQQLVAALYVMAGVLALAVIDRTPAPDPAPVSRAGEAARLPGEATAEPAVR